MKIYDVTDMVAYYLGTTPPFNSLGSFKLGFLPLYKKSSILQEESKSSNIGAEEVLSDMEHARLYSDYYESTI